MEFLHPAGVARRHVVRDRLLRQCGPQTPAAHRGEPGASGTGQRERAAAVSIHFLVDSISPIVAKKTEGERLIYYFPKLTTVKGSGRLLQLDRTWRFTRPIDIDGEKSLIGVFKSDGSDFEIDGIYLAFSEPLYFIDKDYFYVKDSRGHIYLVFRRNPSELEAGDAIYWYNLKDMSIKVKATHGGVLFMGSDNTLLPLAPKRPINFELGGYGEGPLSAPGGTPMEEEEEIS